MLYRIAIIGLQDRANPQPIRNTEIVDNAPGVKSPTRIGKPILFTFEEMIAFLSTDLWDESDRIIIDQFEE